MITAVDPAVGHFLGAVVQNLSATASVVDLGVTADNLATACDGFPDSLAGIRLDGATGAITNNTVTGLQQGTSGDGCQEGNAIEVRNTLEVGTPQVSVTGNTVLDEIWHGRAWDAEARFPGPAAFRRELGGRTRDHGRTYGQLTLLRCESADESRWGVVRYGSSPRAREMGRGPE